MSQYNSPPVVVEKEVEGTSHIMDEQGLLETNLPQIAEVIFSSPPQNPHSIQLGLDELSADQADESTELRIVQFMSVIGMKKLFGHGNPMILSEQEYNQLRKYIQSMGYDVKVYCNDGAYDPWEVAKIHGPDAIQEVRVKYSRLAP
jgi:hypothetical protein